LGSIRGNVAKLEPNDSGGTALVLPDEGQPTFLTSPGSGQLELSVSAPKKGLLAALCDFGGRWVVFPGGSGDPVWVNDIAVVGMKILEHGDVVRVAGRGYTLMQEMEEIIAADSPLVRQSLTCPVCKGAFKAGAPVIICPRCKTAHDPDCWLKEGCAGRFACGRSVKKKAQPEVVGRRE
jgi:hypothetical protein